MCTHIPKSVFHGAFIYHLATGTFCLIHSAMAFFIAVSFDHPVTLWLGEGFGCISLYLFGVQKIGVSLQHVIHFFPFSPSPSHVRHLSLYFLQNSVSLFFCPSVDHWHQTLSALPGSFALARILTVVSLLSSQESDWCSVPCEPSYPLKECYGQFGSYPFSCTIIV